MAILVTGASGYIGSHTCVKLLDEGYEIIGLDNLSNSSKDVIDRVQMITQKTFSFYVGDIRDTALLKRIFQKYEINCVIHFAGLKAVGDSSEIPMEYYDNNVVGTLHLLQIMKEFQVKKIVFSSSATVYAPAGNQAITEDFSLGPINPYGRTKLMNEQMLADVVQSDPEWSIVVLRYFNPIGAHESGLIGENPNGVPTNLLPYVSQVAFGIQTELLIFGNDYNTPDGTGVRDYIHVMDLANGHIKAVKFALQQTGIEFLNLGTGRGYSVLEVVRAFEKSSKRKVKYRLTERRQGDVDICFANTTKANQVLGWKCQFGLIEMCKHAWNWEMKKELILDATPYVSERQG